MLKICVLVDISKPGEYSGDNPIRDKIEGLKLPYIIWAGEERIPEGRQNTVSSMRGLLSYMERGNYDAAIYVEGWQVSLDVNLVRRAIQRLEEGLPDYYTQWEHCRIPAGRGVRVFSARLMRAISVSSPGDYIEKIRKNPDKFQIVYEDTKCRDYQRTLIDESRSLPETAAMIDESGRPAAYGFESRECARFPTYIMFDVTNVCNSRCVHCPHSVTYSKTGASPVFLKMDIFKKVIDECAGKKLQFIRLTADGEPLLHKGLVDMVEYAASKGVGPIGLTTNGSLMTPDIATRLMDAGLFMVDFSLDAARAETYGRIRRGLSYDSVIQNIDHTLKIRAEKKSPLKIMVSFVKQEENTGEDEEFLRKWKAIVDRVLIREMISNVNLVGVPKGKGPGRVKRWPCPHFFRRVVVNYDGVIKTCPVDWENLTAYKPAKETSIYDAWHSDFYWAKRMEHLNNAFPENSACRECNDWQGSPWNLGYEKVVRTL